MFVHQLVSIAETVPISQYILARHENPLKSFFLEFSQKTKLRTFKKELFLTYQTSSSCKCKENYILYWFPFQFFDHLEYNQGTGNMQGPQFPSSFYRKRKRKDPGNDVEKLVVIMTSLEWGQNDVWLINDMYVRLLLNIWCPWHFPGPFCCYDQFDWCTCIFSLIISHIGTSQVISSARLRMVHLQIYLIFQNCKRLNYSLKYYWINLSVHIF